MLQSKKLTPREKLLSSPIAICFVEMDTPFEFGHFFIVVAAAQPHLYPSSNE